MIIDVVETHLSELAALWEQWQSASCSPEMFSGDLSELQERIVAHCDGIFVAGEQAASLLEESLESDDPALVFAATFVLLQMDRDGSFDAILNAFLQAEGEVVEGFRRAFCHAPIESIEDALREAMRNDNITAAAAATEALAFQGRLSRNPSRLPDFFQAEEPSVRQTAWRIAALIDCHDKQP